MISIALRLLSVVKVENFSYRYYACQKLITVVEVKQFFVVADQKWQMGLRHPLIQSRNPKRLNYT